jgi:phage shock protein A
MNNDSVLGKIRLIALGNVHTLLNKAIDMSSSSIIDQHLRDLKDARDQLQNDTAGARGNVSVLKEDIADLVNQIGKKNGDIDALLGDTTADNHDDAVKLQSNVLMLEDAKKAKQVELDTAVQVEASMTHALEAVGHRVEELNSRLETLKHMANAAKAKENAATALNNAHTLAGSDVTSTVDSLEHRIRQNSAVADERLQMALGQTTTPEDSALTARAKAIIADRAKKAKAPADAGAAA